MEIRAALKSQYHAGLAMLRQSVELCPDDLWRAGEFPRLYWRIAFHAIYFADVYLAQSLETFVARPDWYSEYPEMWTDPWDFEPYDLPAEARICTRSEMIAYIDYVDQRLDAAVDGLDLHTTESGFPWYKRTPKLDHQILNIRHIQGHVGQLSELLMAQGIDIRWRS